MGFEDLVKHLREKNLQKTLSISGQLFEVDPTYQYITPLALVCRQLCNLAKCRKGGL
jgi:hypothetical protein